MPSVKTSVSVFFKELSPIPDHLKQPTFIYHAFANQGKDDNHDATWLLTRLFFAIGSPVAFSQLHDACTISRESGAFPIPQANDGVFQTVQALDKLDIAISTASILRRYYLVTLMTHRQQQEEYHKSQRPIRAPRVLKYGDTNPAYTTGAVAKHGFGRASSQALTDLMAEAYPHLTPSPRKHQVAADDEYRKKLQSLKNRLHTARNWLMLQECFGPGVLALVPTHGEYKIQNYE